MRRPRDKQLIFFVSFVQLFLFFKDVFSIYFAEFLVG